MLSGRFQNIENVLFLELAGPLALSKDPRLAPQLEGHDK